jgi:hypothetical protein
MKFRRGKAKAMAPQTETIELPEEIITTNSEPLLYDGGWKFPEGWSDDDIRDWLATHSDGRPQQLTLDIDPGLPPTEDEPVPDDDEVAATMAEGYVAAAFAVPPDLKDKITAENYDPRDFILVHHIVFEDLVAATHAEAELTEENKALRKRVNALTRGMRKVNKHWSATKRELKYALRQREVDANTTANVISDMENLWEADRKRADIFATRLAKRLRKARAGRDKRERQLTQANQVIEGQSSIIKAQDRYIRDLEQRLNG